MSDDLRSIVHNHVKEKLLRGELVISMTVRLVRGIEIARIAKTAGFDTLYVDLEHSSFSLDLTSQICMSAMEIGIAPFVRVPANTPEYISRVLDGGALGVIAPHVNSAEEARVVVRRAKFPPLGERGVSAGLPHLHFRRVPAAEAYAALNEMTMVIVQFETAQAIERADEILGIEGVDMALIGANDLTADIGIPGQYEHPKVREAYAAAIAAAKRHGKHVGIGGLAGQPRLAAEFVRMGARYVSAGTDLAFLLEAASERAKAASAAAADMQN